MSKSKQGTSAAQRRAQEREQRQHIQTQSRNAQNGRPGRRYQKRRNTTAIWLAIVGGLVVVVIVFVVVSTLLSQQNSQKAVQSATTDVFHQITNVSPDLLNNVGNGSVDSSVNQTLKAVKGAPVLTGPNGKPEVFYMGAEYCPFCGAQRWSLTIALSRFGTFNKPLTPILSGEDQVPTYSFYQHSYTSNYVDFVSVETGDNNYPSTNPLEQLSASQQNLVNTYDAPPYVDAQSKGSFPFLSIGNQYVTTGAYYSPTLLIGNSYDQIVTAMKDPTSDTSRAILGSANYLTAQICEVTQNKPSNVCSSSSIQSLQQKLPKATASTTPSTLLAALDVPQSTFVSRKRA
jgi:Domain of unknown function (DUF929).